MVSKFCDEFIDVASDPWASTYCKLLAGHSGDHSPHYPEMKPHIKPLGMDYHEPDNDSECVDPNCAGRR